MYELIFMACNNPRQQMALYTRALLQNADLQAIKQSLTSQFAAKAEILGGGSALLVVASSLAVCDSSPKNVLEMERMESARVYTFLHEFEGKRCAQAISVPDTRYSIVALFPKRDDKYLISMSAYDVAFLGPLCMKIHFPLSAKMSLFAPVLAICRQWHSEAIHIGFLGEHITGHCLEIESPIAGKKTKYATIRLDYEKPVTFPWLELYCRIYSGLDGAQKPLGISFENSSL